MTQFKVFGDLGGKPYLKSFDVASDVEAINTAMAESPGLRVDEVADPSVLRKSCRRCSKEIAPSSTFCRHCDAKIDYAARIARPEAKTSDRKIIVAFLLLFFFGTLGIHAFYLGRPIQGIVLILLFGAGFLLSSTVFGSILLLSGIVFLISDFFRIILGSYADGDGRKVANWT